MRADVVEALYGGRLVVELLSKLAMKGRLCLHTALVEPNRALLEPY